MSGVCTQLVIPLCSPKQAKTPTSLALGSFDGLHAGHRKVIEVVVNDAPGIPSVVSFWPHPREILYSEPRLRLDLPSEKTSLLSPLGVKQLILVPFNLGLASVRAEDFFHEMLIQTLNARRIAVGANFRFGHNREGDVNTLRELGKTSGVEILVMPILKDKEGRMSSSRIRKALAEGNLKRAKSLMGRPYKLTGRVVQGRGLGSKIGWPTANLQVDGRKFLPCLGVYAAFAWINKTKEPLPAVINLGPQPTVDPCSPSAVEVHLLNQKKDLLGENLTIQPIKKLRDQKRFESMEDLSSQIGLDAEVALRHLRI
ncbi:bifunctional riboflavin kinase/FAD synthetase [Prochlorococcus sp. MIT 1341]|uniref:bifunctional riboflavin kinase/FAD synthetase n=1 Tax=Prochlorococcus sp. MIT 1341 TaxID=3096221 RepID=UPI002A750103|nr:bifunctional riboflavin kinase/FAD synthetase [Prochlorococcus sp. MIT 1341]